MSSNFFGEASSQNHEADFLFKALNVLNKFQSAMILTDILDGFNISNGLFAWARKIEHSFDERAARLVKLLANFDYKNAGKVYRELNKFSQFDAVWPQRQMQPFAPVHAQTNPSFKTSAPEVNVIYARSVAVANRVKKPLHPGNIIQERGNKQKQEPIPFPQEQKEYKVLTKQEVTLPEGHFASKLTKLRMKHIDSLEADVKATIERDLGRIRPRLNPEPIEGRAEGEPGLAPVLKAQQSSERRETSSFRYVDIILQNCDIIIKEDIRENFFPCCDVNFSAMRHNLEELMESECEITINKTRQAVGNRNRDDAFRNLENMQKLLTCMYLKERHNAEFEELKNHVKLVTTQEDFGEHNAARFCAKMKDLLYKEYDTYLKLSDKLTEHFDGLAKRLKDWIASDSWTSAARRHAGSSFAAFDIYIAKMRDIGALDDLERSLTAQVQELRADLKEKLSSKYQELNDASNVKDWGTSLSRMNYLVSVLNSDRPLLCPDEHKHWEGIVKQLQSNVKDKEQQLRRAWELLQQVRLDTDPLDDVAFFRALATIKEESTIIYQGQEISYAKSITFIQELFKAAVKRAEKRLATGENFKIKEKKSEPP
eukprot:gb/GEZN01002497.1/.p1 GENE.gb/GEZN01002497.1/~~gb/GEZN01002497.1/.p1  ORF type:complete len:619 (-),score=99.60 gb/GEZN01002497.1/:603-2396(-)